MPNNPVEEAVMARLDQDPRIPDSVEVAVSAEAGMVTLRGTVESFAQRRAAVEDARQVEGAHWVEDQLEVRIRHFDRRADDEIRGAALQKLIWNSQVPAESIDVKVKDGWATLTGDVSYQFESDAAYDDVSNLYGVQGVSNEIKVVNP